MQKATIELLAGGIQRKLGGGGRSFVRLSFEHCQQCIHDGKLGKFFGEEDDIRKNEKKIMMSIISVGDYQVVIHTQMSRNAF